MVDYSFNIDKVKPDFNKKVENNIKFSDTYGVIMRTPTVLEVANKKTILDLTVNILTNFAVNKSEIKVFGGDQLRPNLHIIDYCKVVELLINAESSKIRNEIFNVGYQNLSILEIAKIV